MFWFVIAFYGAKIKKSLASLARNDMKKNKNLKHFGSQDAKSFKRIILEIVLSQPFTPHTRTEESLT